MEKPQLCSVLARPLNDEEQQREKVSENFELGHGLVEERVKVSSSLYFKNS